MERCINRFRRVSIILKEKKAVRNVNLGETRKHCVGSHR